MTTYCTGSARQKRDYFKETDGTVVLDNVEVLFCVSENGRNYFAYGDVPFADFSVAEYLDTNARSIKTRSITRSFAATAFRRESV